jgi:glycosyltransferase involved in cell wall biosynthesis
MRVLYLTDRVSLQGGAPQHLLQVIGAALGAGLSVTIAAGRIDPDVVLPSPVKVCCIKGLASAVASEVKLDGLEQLLCSADLLHVQNVMNPVALERALDHSRSVVTVQDHRVFCPGPGKTRPDGSACDLPLSDDACRACLPDPEYRERLLSLTRRRLRALAGARLVVLSRYMACQLALLDRHDVVIVPPWVRTSTRSAQSGQGFLCGGRLVAHKGLEEAWQAWKMAETGEPLRVAGRGRLVTTLHGAELLGWLDATELRRQLRFARALLFPSRWQEPFGILGVESLAEATPVILFESGGTADWSDQGCVLVPPGDVDAMAAAMKHVRDAPEEMMKLGEAGREMVKRRFPRAEIEGRLIALYEDVAAQPS